MTDKTVTDQAWEPAIFPLAGIAINPPLRVEALNNRGGLKKGTQYMLTAVRADGQVAVMRGGWHSMDSFVELVHPIPAAK